MPLVCGLLGQCAAVASPGSRKPCFRAKSEIVRLSARIAITQFAGKCSDNRISKCMSSIQVPSNSCRLFTAHRAVEFGHENSVLKMVD